MITLLLLEYVGNIYLLKLLVYTFVFVKEKDI